MGMGWRIVCKHGHGWAGLGWWTARQAVETMVATLTHLAEEQQSHLERSSGPTALRFTAEHLIESLRHSMLLRSRGNMTNALAASIRVLFSGNSLMREPLLAAVNQVSIV